MIVILLASIIYFVYHCTEFSRFVVLNPYKSLSNYHHMELQPLPTKINTFNSNKLHLNLYPTKATLYHKRLKDPFITYQSEALANARSNNVVTPNDNLKLKRQTNNLSNESIRKVKRAFSYMELVAKWKLVKFKNSPRSLKFKLAFITLTLPSKQIHSDKELKKECFDRYLQCLRDKYKVKHYIWRAEIQGNGNIHWHVVIDKFIHHRDVRKDWNKYVNRLGYVDRFYEKFGTYDPSSTEIKSVKNSRQANSYLVKYITKGDNKMAKGESKAKTRMIEGRMYGISQSLKQMRPITINQDSKAFKIVGRLALKYSRYTTSSKYNSTIFYPTSTYRNIYSWLERQVDNWDDLDNGMTIAEHNQLIDHNSWFKMSVEYYEYSPWSDPTIKEWTKV